LGIYSVQEPVGVRLDAAVPLAMRKHREQSMAWLVRVFNNFLGLPFTQPDIELYLNTGRNVINTFTYTFKFNGGSSGIQLVWPQFN
jgi:hypothetical protein